MRPTDARARSTAVSALNVGILLSLMVGGGVFIASARDVEDGSEADMRESEL